MWLASVFMNFLWQLSSSSSVIPVPRTSRMSCGSASVESTCYPGNSGIEFLEHKSHLWTQLRGGHEKQSSTSCTLFYINMFLYLKCCTQRTYVCRENMLPSQYPSIKNSSQFYDNILWILRRKKPFLTVQCVLIFFLNYGFNFLKWLFLVCNTET